MRESKRGMRVEEGWGSQREWEERRTREERFGGEREKLKINNGVRVRLNLRTEWLVLKSFEPPRYLFKP